jgi:hypothetical protein
VIGDDQVGTQSRAERGQRIEPEIDFDDLVSQIFQQRRGARCDQIIIVD